MPYLIIQIACFFLKIISLPSLTFGERLAENYIIQTNLMSINKWKVIIGFSQLIISFKQIL